MSLLRTGTNWLASKRREHLTDTVTYRRGVLGVALPATKGRSEFQGSDTQGMVIQDQAIDWLITAADLVLNSVAAEPARGDTVEETIGATTFVYEVMAPSSVPVWRWSDAGHKTMRVHTKLVED